MLSSLLVNLGFPMFGKSPAMFVVSATVAFLIMITFGRPFINAMRAWQGRGQPIRDDGPESHLSKAGTPTMGGILMLIAIIVSAVLFMDYRNPAPWIAIASLVVFGAIGFADDYGKVKKQSAYAGLSKWGRLVLEGVAALVIAYFVNRTMPAYVPELSIYVPIFHRLLHFGFFYFVFAYFVIVGSANAANITDGMDGVLSKVYLPVLIVIGVALYGATHIHFLAGGVFLPEAAGLYPVIGATLGAILGFLWYNSAPAAIFMGDIGSLALGGMMGTMAMLLKSEVVIGIAALMMVIVLGSSFLQTTVYKLTKGPDGRGKRIFKMAPLHHHFELCGWAESKITERFFILSIIFSAIAIAILKI
ncbi:MAG: phospho-N-acetylmuramoyl-pentapeptide-transferase [Proteobacteria bacterium]|nr:phospho-N-acetylmuramoyl-pentapeptide-transferase [Pseudomonadota bacterium]